MYEQSPSSLSVHWFMDRVCIFFFFKLSSFASPYITFETVAML